MGNPSAAHEPSMEEILASIRQIISEDGEPAEGEADSPQGGDDAPAMTGDAEGEREPAAAAYASEPAADEAEGAAETADHEPAPITSASPAPAPDAPQHRPEPTLRRQPAAAPATPAPDSDVQQPPRPVDASGPAPQAAGQAMAAGTMPASARADDERRLLSPKSDASVSGAFSALAHTILAQNARTLEDLVSEMLRPMLKEWLDDNLPPLVERLVKEEIERVSRGRH